MFALPADAFSSQLRCPHERATLLNAAECESEIGLRCVLTLRRRCRDAASWERSREWKREREQTWEHRVVCFFCAWVCVRLLVNVCVFACIANALCILSLLFLLINYLYICYSTIWPNNHQDRHERYLYTHTHTHGRKHVVEERNLSSSITTQAKEKRERWKGKQQ